MKRLLNRTFIHISSLNFTIILLVMFLLTILADTMEDEIVSFFRGVYLPGGSTVNNLLHFYHSSDLHASWWFKTLLALFFLNLLTCMAKRTPGTLRALSLHRFKDVCTKPSSPPFEDTFAVANLSRGFEHGLYSLLANNLSRPFVYRSAESSVFFSQRGRCFHGGFYLAHGGLLIVLTGGVLGSSSPAGEMYLREGESADRLFLIEKGTPCFRKLDYALRLDKCEPLPSPPEGTDDTNSSHITYRSTVTMLREGAKDITGLLEGYQTLTGHGTRVCQSGSPEEDSRRISLSILSRKAGGKRRTFSLRRYQYCSIPETGHTVRLKNLFFNSAPLKNTASGPLPCMAMLEVYGDNRSLIYKPLVSSHASSPGQPWDGEYEFLLKGVEESGTASRCMCLSICPEPGAYLIWTGAVIAITGFSLILLLSHRKVWVAIERSNGGYSITVAGWTSRNPDVLKHYASLIRKMARQCTAT